LAEAQSYNLTFGGDAIIGTDIDFPYTEILFPVDEDSVLLTFQAIQDFLTEGQESLVITMENIGCLTTSAEVTINVYDLPDLQVSVADALINCGDVAIFTPIVTGGVGDYTIAWPGGFEGPSFQVSPDVATSYPFIVSDTCGVIPFSGSVDVDFIVNPPLTVEVSDDLTATCLDVQDFQPVVNGGLPPYEVVWFINGLQESTSNNLTFQSDVNATLEFEVTDQCGITVSDAFVYAVPPVPVLIDLGGDLTLQCIDEVVFDLMPMGGVGAYQIDWFVDGNFQNNGPNFNDFFFADALLEVEVMDECGNSAADEVAIAIPAIPMEVTLPNDIYSDCLTIQTIEPVVSEGAGVLTYTWLENEELFSTATFIDYTSNEDAMLILNVSDQCGNSASDSVNVFIPPAPISISASPDTVICLYDGVLLSATAIGGIGDLTFRWDSGSAAFSQFVAPTASTDYSLEVTDECGNSASVDISVGVDFIEPNFSAAYASDDVVSFTNLLPDSVMTFWEFSDGSVSNEHNTEHRFNTLEEWVATLHAYTALGCHGELSQTFQPTGDFFVPSSFTPNFDGINDVWKPVGRDLLSYEVKIFNRYGQVVFETNDMNESWTGGVLGSNYFAPNGLYSFTLRATDNRYNTIERSGYLQLMR
jgi:gliding motility-associated-like protein